MEIDGVIWLSPSVAPERALRHKGLLKAQYLALVVQSVPIPSGRRRLRFKIDGPQEGGED